MQFKSVVVGGLKILDAPNRITLWPEQLNLARFNVCHAKFALGRIRTHITTITTNRCKFAGFAQLVIHNITRNQNAKHKRRIPHDPCLG